ncbi:hypothetical protein [Sanguibacter sp. HDW7]|uniref:hypothetical protein n=1 Tax=Sanguibacter sp. HDW7 TaxID=2714931 RepID=UPI00140B9E0D|nr:hypothetical protein [Sanguibacter sp. HDW7]QIK83848.1 hypothetical protein G7063_09585 [Sanguibacter sp. HDW7]
MAVLGAVSANRGRDETSSWLALSHLQFLSLVAYEVRHFMRRTARESIHARAGAHELALAASRHSTKLFNDTKKSQLELLAEFVSAAARDRNWYLDNNRAPRLVQSLLALGLRVNDTSVVLYGEQIMCTSHSIRFHAGISPQDEGAETFDRARELAASLRALAGTEVDEWGGDDYLREWPSRLIVVKDAQFRELYAALFPSTELPEAIALGILKSDLVTLKLIREMVPLSDPLAPTTFKFRFSGVWQVLETLRSILGPGGDFALPEAMRKDLAALFDGESIKPMTTGGARSLRNILVHYGIGSVDVAKLIWNDPLIGLPELHFDGADWLATDQIVGEAIIALLAMFEGWTGPFHHTLEDLHE